MPQSSQRTMQEFTTTLAPADVLARAKQFFSRRNSLYAVFVEHESPTHVNFRGQGTEEIVIAAIPRDGATLVTGSTYLFDMQIARFFTTLPELETAHASLTSGAAVPQVSA